MFPCMCINLTVGELRLRPLHPKARIIYQSVEWLRNVVGVLLGRKLQSSRLRRSDSASPFGDDLILNRKTLILDLDGTLVHATPHT